MKNITLLMFALLLTNCISAQTYAIKITNLVSKKEIVIKQNRRIKIKTIDGKKISGRFSVDNKAIVIKNNRIEFSDIEEIKRNPLLVSILTTGLLVYGGAIMAGFGVLVGVLADSTAFLLLVPAAAMIYVGTKSPNLYKNYKKDSQWTFEIIRTSD